MCLRVHESLSKWGCSLVSWSTNCSSHTWLHSSTFRHRDESNAPFLHFCSHIVLLGHSGSCLCLNHTHRSQNFIVLVIKKNIFLILENYKIFFSKKFWNPTWPFSEPVFVKADELFCHFLMSTLQLLVLSLASAKMSQYILIKCFPLRRNLKEESVAR